MTTKRRLALVGYGKMGKLIDELASEYGFEVVLRLHGHENAGGSALTADRFANIDVAVEFSTPEAAPINMKRLAELRIPTITGTTGWLDSLAEVTRTVENSGSALLWSPNFSVGIAVFQKLTSFAAELLRHESEYGAWAWEIHHDAKKDARSGTILHLVEGMRKAGYERPIDIGSNRAGKHPGTHEIGFDSAADTITLRHVARTREGFARGALKAAAWIPGKTGVHTFEEMLFDARA